MWAIVFLFLGITFLGLTFFLIVYFAELKRERTLRQEYYQQLKDFKNVPIYISDFDSFAKQLGQSALKKSKKVISEESEVKPISGKKKTFN